MNASNLIGVPARQLVQRMGEATENFLAALSTDQRAKAQLDFANQEERTNWHYTPIPRSGLPFLEMDRTQQRLAQKLVMTGLSRLGYMTATTIMGLETTLDAVEGFTAQTWWRDSRLYFVSIFGQPDEKKPWGWRFEGHHISLNYTIVGGQIVAPTPTFFGSNPGETDLLGGQKIRPLASIEDLARDLMHALNDDQRTTALLTPIAPPDMVTLNRPFVIENALSYETPGIVDPPSVQMQFPALERMAKERGITVDQLEPTRYTTTPKGIAVAKMNGGQQEILQALIGDYIHRMPEELAEIEMKKLEQLGMGNIHFAWAGGLARRQPHYYRLQGPRFLVEYDNTQNGANHIHSVWRDPSNDFGADMLQQHYATEHKH